MSKSMSFQNEKAKVALISTEIEKNPLTALPLHARTSKMQKLTEVNKIQKL